MVRWYDLGVSKSILWLRNYVVCSRYNFGSSTQISEKVEQVINNLTWKNEKWAKKLKIRFLSEVGLWWFS